MAAPDLTGRQVNQTYKNLLQIDNSNSGIDATLRPIKDGEGTASVLQLSTTAVTINGLTYPTADGTSDQVIKTDGSGNLSFATVSSGSTGLDDLTDVTITAVASGELIKYDGAGWINNTLAEAGISAVGHTHVAANITDLATAAVAFSNKTGNISQWTNDSAYITVAGVPVPTTITVANEATDTTCFIAFFTAATGDLGPKTNNSLTFNSNTGLLAATAFSGPLTGNVTGNVSGSSGSCTGNAATATALQTPRTIGGTAFDGTANIVPATITVADTADATCSVALFESATGDLGPKTDAGLTYAADTGTLTATAFVGALTGNVTGNVSGSSGSTTGNAATVTTNANLTGPITSVGNATSIASQTGTGTKFVVDTGPTLVTPVLGVATATSINKVALTAPATSATLTIADGATLTVSASATVSNGTHSGTNTGDQNLFRTIAVSGQSDVVADTTTDTLTLAAGSNITITTDAGTDTVTIAATGGGTIGDGDYGDVTASSSGTVLTVDSFTVADAGGDTTTWPLLSLNVTGANQVACTDPGITYNATTNALSTTTFIGALTGNASTATSAATLTTPRAIGGVNFDGSAAITPANITIANEATDTTCFPLFVTAATGDLPPKSNANLTYNSNTGAFGSTSFVGDLVGNVTGNVSGTSGSTTGNAATVTVADAANDTTTWVLLGTSQTGSLAPATDADITYNANTGALSSTTFIGALTGNVTGNVTGSSGSCTGNSATVTTNANLTGDVTSVGNATTLTTVPVAAFPHGLAYCMAQRQFCA